MKRFIIDLVQMNDEDFPLSPLQIIIEADNIIEKTYGHKKQKDGHEDIESSKRRLLITNIRKVETRGPVESYDEYKKLYEVLKAAIGHDVVVKYRVIDILNPKSGWWVRNVQNPKVEIRKKRDKFEANLASSEHFWSLPNLV